MIYIISVMCYQDKNQLISRVTDQLLHNSSAKGMSSSILASSASIENTFNGCHSSALSHCCCRKLPNSDLLLLKRNIPDLILDISLKEKHR